MVKSPPRLWSLTDCTTNYRSVLSSERTAQDEEQRMEKEIPDNTWSWATNGCPTPRRIGRLTIGHNINSSHRNSSFYCPFFYMQYCIDGTFIGLPPYAANTVCSWIQLAFPRFTQKSYQTYEFPASDRINLTFIRLNTNICWTYDSQIKFGITQSANSLMAWIAYHNDPKHILINLYNFNFNVTHILFHVPFYFIIKTTGILSPRS
jgi:hypothetical protein